MSYITYLYDVVRDIKYEGENAQVERIPITHETLEVADAVERERSEQRHRVRAGGNCFLVRQTATLYIPCHAEK